MDAVTQLMRKRHHVARFAKIVQHHIGMHGGHRRMRKGAGGLAGFDTGVDPALVEEGGGKVGHARVEGAVGVGHGLARFGPVDDFRRLDGQGRVAVPDLQLVQTHPLGLETIVAVGKLGVGRDNRVAQRLDDLGFHMVGQVPPGLWRRHLAPAVVDFLFLGQRVVDPGKKLDVAAKDLRQSMGRRLAPCADGVGQKVQRRLKVQLFRIPLDREHEARHRLVEQLVPRACADHAFVMQELFQLVRKLVRPHRAHAVEHRLVAGKPGVGSQEPCQMRVLKPVEFKAEEHQRRGGRGHPVLRIAHELRALGVDGVLIVAQARIGHQASGKDLDPLILFDADAQGRGIEGRQLALIAGGKPGAQRFKRGHVAGEFRAVRRGVKVGQVPVGQGAEAATGGVGIEDGLGQGQGHGKAPLGSGVSRARGAGCATPGTRGQIS